jgi:hypothetical protein
VRADVGVTDFPPILEMLGSVTGHGQPSLPHRYIGLILAGLRPDPEPLPGEPITRERLLELVAAKG